MYFTTNPGAIRGPNIQRCTGKITDSTQQPAEARSSTMVDFISVMPPDIIFVLAAKNIPKKRDKIP